MLRIAGFVFFIMYSVSGYGQFPSGNRSAHFTNATDEGISIPYQSSFTFSAAQSFTVEAWVKTTDASSCQMIFSHQYCYASPGSSPGVLFFISGGIPYINIQDNSTNYVTTGGGCGIADGNWHHIAGVRNTTTDSLYLYIDGVEAGRTLDPTSSDITHVLATNWVGRRTWCGSVCNFYGDIDEVRVWFNAKSQEQIIAEKDHELTGSETALKLYYNFNSALNGNGNTVQNNCSATGTALNGTVNGTASEPAFQSAQPASSFIPCDPVLWLKADGTLTRDGSNHVSQWNDVSASAYHVTQSNPAYQPLYIASGPGNKPALYFDGSNGKYFLQNTSSNPVASGGARTVFVVGKRDCTVHSGGLIGGTLLTFRRSALVHTLSFGVNYYGGPVYVYSDGNGIGNNNATISGGLIDSAVTPFMLTYQIPAGGGQLSCRMNGIAQAVNQGSGSVAAETGTNGFTVGDREDQADLDWSGWIQEIIVYARELKSDELRAVEYYLQQKYSGTLANFDGVPASQQAGSSILDDYTWKHSFAASNNSKVVASVRDYCFDLGIRSDTVYVEPTAGTYNSRKFMRRHYVIKTSANPAGTKRVRLYFTAADLADLQAASSGISSIHDLVVTHYSGPDEDGIFNPANASSMELISEPALRSGTAFGNYYLEFDVTRFGEFWIHSGNSLLPLQFIRADARKNAGQIEVYWETANEEQVRSFTVERSSNQIQFTEAGRVDAKNQSYNRYQFTDRNAGSEPVWYYRIRQTDTDGNIRYSKTISVKNSSVHLVQIAPNPVTNGMATLSGYEQLRLIKILDLGGRELSRTLYPGRFLPVPRNGAGMYILYYEQKDGEAGQLLFYSR